MAIPTVPVPVLPRLESDEMKVAAGAFADLMAQRRTVRDFSSEPVSRDVIESCIRAAGTAPSGANHQPWHFVLVPQGEIRQTIRDAAEIEEREFYERRAPEDWLDALAPLGTNEEKPFLEEAPWLIAIFLERNHRDADGNRVKHYYMPESVGIATGILITALHSLGLATLTHTPSPMGFLNTILGRPKNERPYLLLVTGYPKVGARVPDIQRKALDEICSIVRHPAE